MTDTRALREGQRDTEAIVAALVWCRLGGHTDASGKRWAHPIEMFGHERAYAAFAEAKREGLLAQDSIWRATEDGNRLLRAEGLLR